MSLNSTKSNVNFPFCTIPIKRKGKIVVLDTIYYAKHSVFQFSEHKIQFYKENQGEKKNKAWPKKQSFTEQSKYIPTIISCLDDIQDLNSRCN